MVPFKNGVKIAMGCFQTVQCPKLGAKWSVLMWDSFILDSFAEVMLFSVTGIVAASLVIHKQ